MGIIDWVIKAISRVTAVVSALYKYREVYKVTGLFATRKFAPAEKKHKYAVLVAARNEESVIGNLIESIRNQDYPSELVDIFVVADNCSDRTREAAEKRGAICFERKDAEHRTKGFALQYLVKCIDRDYGIDSYEGYFLFDADNLLKSDFISRMNDSFDAGEKIVTSYRNTKNFGDNWIAASYGLHWLRTIRNEHRARSLFRLATRIQGTGFLFSWELIKDGWNYTSLTEDRAFCADAVARGYEISYNNEAEFYDEQPVSMKIALRQRLRWAKGHLQALTETGPMLFKHIFFTDGAAGKKEKATLPKRFLNGLRLRFMSFDMLTVVFPNSLMQILRDIVIFLLRLSLVLATGRVFGIEIAPGIVRGIAEKLGVLPEIKDGAQALAALVVFTLAWQMYSYVKGIIIATYIFIVERKRILPIKWYKKVWYCITFPIFDIIGKFSMLAALFVKVEWKPIPHNAAVSISEIERSRQ